MIRQGDLYWMDFGEPSGAAPGYRNPCVVVQNDLTNRTSLKTVIVCTLTSNVRLALAPGNILLDDGEGGLPKRSVVNVSQIATVDRDDLEDYLGRLSPERVRQILDGLRELIEPRDL